VPARILDAVETVRREKVRGASWALATIARALIEAVEEGELDCKDPEAVAGLIEDVNRSMAPLANLALIVRRTCPKGPQALLEALRDLLYYASTARERLVEAGRLLDPDTRLSTISYSSSVEAVIHGGRDRIERVVVFESRPGGEGALLAGTLRVSGFDVVLAPDTMMPAWVSESSLVLVGADAVTLDGCFLNKLGTLQLAIVARHYGVPLAPVFDATKIHPTATCDTIHVEERRYLVAGYGPVRYPLFDKVPLSMASLVITDKGPMEPDPAKIRRLWEEVFASYTGGTP